MVFSYHQVQEHPRLLLAMTSLTHAEFHQLLPHFQYAWDQYVQQYYVARGDRQRQYGAGRVETTLVTIEDKLLFILYYVKVYPLQEILAFEFGMVQSTANVGRPNWLSAVDRFLDSKCQSRFSDVRWRHIFHEKRFLQGCQLRATLIFTIL
jgi:hypothetical protein